MSEVAEFGNLSISDIVETDDGHTMSFKLKGCSLGIANGIRRTLLGDTPSFAIDLIEFQTNSTQLDDEFLGTLIR